MDKINSDTNATKIARMISLNLRHGVLIKNIVAALDRVEEAFVGSDSESSDIHLSATFATKFCDIISAERLAVDVGGTLIQVTEEFIRESNKIELGE